MPYRKTCKVYKVINTHPTNVYTTFKGKKFKANVPKNRSLVPIKEKAS